MILSFLGQYHGESTYLTAALGTDLAEVTSNNAQYVSGVVFAPYPNAYRAPFHRGPGPFDDTLYVDFIEDWIAVHQVEPEQLAAVLIEPIAGEGGVLIPSGAFWDRLVSFCTRHGIKIILDEVQTGIGRCGTMFAAERWDLRPDLLLLAKGLAGGAMPIAAILGTEAVLANSETHGSGTFAWVPPACAGALANIDLIIRDRILENVQRLEAIARSELVPLVDRVEQVGDVRVAGAMIGIEFVQSRRSGSPAPAFQSAVHDEALRRGVFGITQAGKWVYRLQPALNMPPALFEWSCHRIAEAIAAVAANPPREAADYQRRQSMP
jgi:4-aminobutyrate aminotransferase-like enzyme